MIEGNRGLLTPITETDSEIELLQLWTPRVVWVTNVGEREPGGTLLQISALSRQTLKLPALLFQIA